MSAPTTPPVPGQRKVKLVTALKTTLAEQTAKLQSKHELEHDLLEDVRNYAKQRAALEKDYAQGILKITTQMLSKLSASKNQSNIPTDETEQLRSPYGLWSKILEETESMANSRMKISQTLLSDVADSIKNFKVERVSTLKKCTGLSEKLHEEMVVSTSDLVKSQKAYSELQKLTGQAHQQASDAKEKLQSGNISIFSSRAKLEKNASKTKDRKDASEKRSTTARNEYLLTLAALNAHQSKYYSQDLPDLIAMQDGKIYENLKDYYTIITDVERGACQECLKSLDDLGNHVKLLERAYAINCFLQDNPIFTKCEPYEFSGIPGDNVTKISDQYGAALTLNKEARKWTLRLVREQKAIRKKRKKLRMLKNKKMNSTANDLAEDASNPPKSPEETIDDITEEIRHLEVLKTKAEGRVEALKFAGVDVDEWLQGTSDHDDDEEENDSSSNNENNYVDDDEFSEEWDDSFTNYNSENYSDDGLSISSSLDHKSHNHTNQAIALYAFEATSREELSINVGEELEVLDTEGDGWCRTRNKSGDVGFVPETYIEVKISKTWSEDGESLSKASNASSFNEVHISDYSLSSNFSSVGCSDLDTTPTPMTMGFEPSRGFICFVKAIYDYDAMEDEELSFHEGDIIMVTSKMVDDDDGWWEGVLNGAKGVFPSLLVEETKAPDSSLGDQDVLLSQNIFNNDLS